MCGSISVLMNTSTAARLRAISRCVRIAQSATHAAMAAIKAVIHCGTEPYSIPSSRGTNAEHVPRLSLKLQLSLVGGAAASRAVSESPRIALDGSVLGWIRWPSGGMMLQTISRGDFLRLVGVKSSTLDQRVLTGEA